MPSCLGILNTENESLTNDRVGRIDWDLEDAKNVGEEGKRALSEEEMVFLSDVILLNVDLLDV